MRTYFWHTLCNKRLTKRVDRSCRQRHDKHDEILNNEKEKKREGGITDRVPKLLHGS